MKHHRDSSDVPSARRLAASLPLPHDKSRTERSAEIDALLERIATPAPKAGRRQALNTLPSDSRSKLELVADPVPPPGPSTQAANNAFVARTFELASGTTNTVDYIAIATQEFQEGRIDQPLWARAFVESGGDESSAWPNYLRARATALRLKDRVRQAEGAGSRARASLPSIPNGASATRHDVAADTARQDDARIKAFLRSPITILAMLTVLVTTITLVIAFASSRSTVDPIVGSRPISGTRSVLPTGTGKSMPASNDAAEAVAKQGYMKAIKGLKDAGQWNDVVLQASAWTAKEPDNAAAWNELSIGYASTQRLDEAHAAARRAVELAPNNALWWRNLGKLSVDRDVPIEALLAFEEATRWNARDGYSFVQAGILNARLDHLSDAKLAFDTALALNPGDVSARCGVAFVEQKQRPADARGGTKPPANAACRNLIDQASKGVDLRRPAASGDAPSQAN